MSTRAFVPALALAAAVLLAGCPALDPMQRQQKVKAYQTSTFYADGLAMRHPPAGTVPHAPPLDPAVATGMGPDGKPVTLAPVPLDAALLARGRNRFDVYCAVCHGVLGDGQSQVALNMSLRRPPSLHDFRDLPDGTIYQVITQGFGVMPGYAVELSPRDRWAVVSYVRALQLSQHASLDQVPPEARGQLQEDHR